MTSETAVALIVGYSVKIVGVIVALFIARIAATWAGNAVTRSLQKQEFDATLTRFFGNLARYGVLAMAVLACLGVFGIETTSFAAVIGAAGLAVGLAFQGSLSNFAAGVMLLVFRPFKVGDLISAAGVEGSVIEIDLFTTTLDTLQNTRMIVPNSAIFGATILNMTHHPVRRCDIAVGADYGADVDATRAALVKAGEMVTTRDPDRGAEVFLAGLGASSVDWELRVWCKPADYWATHQQTVRAIKLALDEAGIGIPYATMDVNFGAAGELTVIKKAG